MTVLHGYSLFEQIEMNNIEKLRVVRILGLWETFEILEQRRLTTRSTIDWADVSERLCNLYLK